MKEVLVLWQSSQTGDISSPAVFTGSSHLQKDYTQILKSKPNGSVWCTYICFILTLRTKHFLIETCRVFPYCTVIYFFWVGVGTDGFFLRGTCKSFRTPNLVTQVSDEGFFLFLGSILAASIAGEVGIYTPPWLLVAQSIYSICKI